MPNCLSNLPMVWSPRPWKCPFCVMLVLWELVIKFCGWATTLALTFGSGVPHTTEGAACVEGQGACIKLDGALVPFQVIRETHDGLGERQRSKWLGVWQSSKLDFVVFSEEEGHGEGSLLGCISQRRNRVSSGFFPVDEISPYVRTNRRQHPSKSFNVRLPTKICMCFSNWLNLNGIYRIFT